MMSIMEWMFGKKDNPVEAKPWPYKLHVCIDRIKYEYRETRKFKERVRGRNHEVKLSDDEFSELVRGVKEYYHSNNQLLASVAVCRDGGIDMWFNSAEVSPFYDNEWVGSWY
jgi:hypothetical protein